MEKIVDMTDALKQVREYKKEPEQEKLVVTKTDKKINSPAYQNYKAGDTTLIDLEEQKRQLEEEIKCLSEEMDSMIQEKRQEGFAVRYSLDGKRLVQAYKTEKDAEHRAEILKSMGGVKDVSITKHTLNFKEEVLDEFTNFKSITFKPKGKYVSDGKYEIVYDYGRKALVTKKQLNVWLKQKFIEIEEELKEGGENDRVRELLQKQETKGLSNSEKKELRELIKTISAGMFEDEQLSQNESFVDKWANILKIKVGDKVKFVDKGGAHFGKKGKVIRDHGDGSYSVEILFPSGRTLTPNNVKNKDIVKEEVLEELFGISSNANHRSKTIKMLDTMNIKHEKSGLNGLVIKGVDKDKQQNLLDKIKKDVGPFTTSTKDIVKEEVLDEASPTIAKVKDIAKNKQAAKIDGTTVDLFTASAISQVYDKVNDVNKKKMDGMKIIPLANIAMKLLKNEYEPVELDDAVIKEKNND